jgi:hypothetical protein
MFFTNIQIITIVFLFRIAANPRNKKMPQSSRYNTKKEHFILRYSSLFS